METSFDTNLDCCFYCKTPHFSAVHRLLLLLLLSHLLIARQNVSRSRLNHKRHGIGPRLYLLDSSSPPDRGIVACNYE